MEYIAYRTNAHTITGGVGDTKIVIDSVQWMDRIVLTAKVEGDIKHLSTWYSPVLVLRVIHSVSNTTVDGVRHIPWYLREGESTVDDCDEPAFRG